MQKPLKILVVRFSSIGDIVLTTPVVRVLKKELNAEVHFITKDIFKSVVSHNPYIDKIHTIKSSVKEIIEEIKEEKFDWIIDLHNNLRSAQLKSIMVKSKSYNKLNFRKFLLTNFGMNILPKSHTVNRYLDTISHLGAKNDGLGLDYFLSKEDEIEVPHSEKPFITFAIGGTHFTKILPTAKIISICNKQEKKVILIGGKEDFEKGEEVAESCKNVINTCGKYTINQSAYIVKNSDLLITHDTGMMHIAAAFNMKIYSVFGGTHHSLGFTPYLPNSGNKIIEVENLSCRPCHRYGKSSCPKGHFKCMNLIDENLFTE